MVEKTPEPEREPIGKQEGMPEQARPETKESLRREKTEDRERKERLSEEEQVVREQLEREIEKMKLTPELQEEAIKQAQGVQALQAKAKLEKLLAIAEEKGISFAVKVVKSMNDPYMLDVFHDTLARDELHKKFSR